jgi:hypothetical protein
MSDQITSCRSRPAMDATEDAFRRLSRLPDDAFIRAGMVRSLFQISDRQLYRELKRPDSRIPKPVSRRNECRKWRVGDIRKALRGESA